MATGIGDKSPRRQPSDPEADEHGPKHELFDKARTATAKLNVSFSYGKYPWACGEVVRYNSTQTIVLTAAMDALVKRREGPQNALSPTCRLENPQFTCQFMGELQARPTQPPDPPDA